MIVWPYDRQNLWLSSENEELMIWPYDCPVKMQNLWLDLMIVRVDDRLVDDCLLSELTIYIWFSWPVSGRDLTLHIEGPFTKLFFCCKFSTSKLKTLGNILQYWYGDIAVGIVTKNIKMLNRVNLWVRKPDLFENVKRYKAPAEPNSSIWVSKICQFILSGRWLYPWETFKSFYQCDT